MSEKTPADEAREIMASNGITPEMVSVRDYPCSDNCGTGPRFLTKRRHHTPVCWNLDELRKNIEDADCTGEELVKLIF
jgi:hypothetical protein